MPGRPIRTAPTLRSATPPREPVQVPILDSKAIYTGVVRGLNTGRGFGFIVPDDADWECFFHFSVIRGGHERFLELRPGISRVQFQAISSPKGPRATAVWEAE